MRLVRLRGRARLIDRGDVVSDLLDEPGATHDLFDVLAACLLAAAPGPSLAMLGFAAGGVVAPLRAMGFCKTLEAVDLDRAGHALFARTARDWPGTVRFHCADALEYLARGRRGLDGILDDLSIPARGGHVKPGVSFAELPRLARARLGTSGVLVSNVLPPVDRSWLAALRGIAAPFRRAVVLRGEDWENRIVVAGNRLPHGPELARRIRELLKAIGSNQAQSVRASRFQ